MSVTSPNTISLPIPRVAEQTIEPEVEQEPEIRTLREIEQEVIMNTLEQNDGDKPKTAHQLGIALKTLYNKLNQYEAQTRAFAG